MTLTTGTRLGTYEVVALIGAGGMGEVYRAHDTRLGRDVALKVLPEAFARDGQRMARFEREAKLLASLNHPNIAAIYGLEESGPIRALVMELVEGPTLAERVAGGAVPVEEALPIARQVADAVEYAHDNNVIHRDLKPANIKVKADGMVKVLDFGLAKAMSEEPSAADINNSPTLSMAATRQGVILGTAAYMSPEQAKGKTADRRADVWAFGVVLFELLTGRQAFQGDDVTEILAAVVMKEPALDALPAKTPPAIRNLVRRCLEKNLRRRLPHIGEARMTIEDVLSGATPAEPVPAAPRKSRERLLVVVAAALFVALVAALTLGALAYFRRAPAQALTMRFFVSLPDSWILPAAGLTTTAPLAVSPDGQRVAFLARSKDGRSLLWVRALNTLAAQSLAGTENALRPFWSPDSRFLGFFAGGKLKKIDISGGPPITLCDVPDGFGGAWSRDGVIVFVPTVASPVQKVSASGGVPTAATTLGEGESGHRMPFFLPDGRHFLYRAVTATGGSGGPIYVASLDLAQRKMLLNADSSNVLYTQGHLIFLRETTLMAQPFDAERLELTGEVFPIAEQIQTQGNPLAGVFSASENGVLAYQTGAAGAGSQLGWFDRTGKPMGVLGGTALYSDLDLSPDGKRASVNIQESGNRDIWIHDVARGLRTRFTFDPAEELMSLWSPDGSRVVFNSRRKGHLDLYQKPSSGAGPEELLLEDNRDKYPVSWSSDGQFILYGSTGGPTSSDLFALPLSGDRKPSPFLQTQFNEGAGQFSPDGRWVAYSSNASGRMEIYVAPFPGPGGKWQISTAGGLYPRWRQDGTELFYLALDNKLMAAAVNGKGPSFEIGAVKPLFETRTAGIRYPYDVSADGQRFLINTAPEQAVSAPFTVVLNWTAGLKR